VRSNSQYAYWWENGFEGHFGFGKMIQDEIWSLLMIQKEQGKVAFAGLSLEIF